MQKKTPKIIQMQYGEGAIACLAMVLAYWGNYKSIKQIKENVKLSRSGISFEELIKTAESYGLEVNVCEGEFDTLCDKFKNNSNRPIIVRYRRNGYVVVTKIKNNRITFNDPRYGKTTVTHEKFKQLYKAIFIELKPGSNFKTSGKPPSIYKLLRARLVAANKAFILIAALTAATLGLNVIYLWVSKFAIDDLLNQKAESSSVWIIGVMAFTFVASTALYTWRTLAMYKTSDKLGVITSRDLLNHLIEVPLNFYDQHFKGDILSRIRNNQNINVTLIRGVIPNVISGFLSIVYVVMMFYYSIFLAVIFLCIEAIYLAASLKIQKEIKIISRSTTTNSTLMESYVLQGLNSIETIKATASENDYFQAWNKTQSASIKSRYNYQNLNLRFSLVQSLYGSLTGALLLIFGAFLIMNGNITFGVLYAFTGIFSKIRDAVSTCLTATNNLATMQTNIERVDDIMDTPAQSIKKTGSHCGLEGSFKVCNINYKYNEEDRFELNDISFEVPRGKILALVGRSGSGKSTLIKIVSNLIEGYNGNVVFKCLNGKYVDINDITSEELYDTLSCVDQENVFFNETLADNLSWWDPHQDFSEMQKCAQIAEIKNRIYADIDGLNAIVTENGRNFSGGELNRLELTRALYQNPKIVLLDEFTSGLDSITENKIFNNLREHGYTCLVAAHRISTIAHCDSVVMLKQGKVVASGTHEELASSNDDYKELICVE